MITKWIESVSVSFHGNFTRIEFSVIFFSAAPNIWVVETINAVAVTDVQLKIDDGATLYNNFVSFIWTRDKICWKLIWGTPQFTQMNNNNHRSVSICTDGQCFDLQLCDDASLCKSVISARNDNRKTKPIDNMYALFVDVDGDGARSYYNSIK